MAVGLGWKGKFEAVREGDERVSAGQNRPTQHSTTEPQIIMAEAPAHITIRLAQVFRIARVATRIIGALASREGPFTALRLAPQRTMVACFPPASSVASLLVPTGPHVVGRVAMAAPAIARVLLDGRHPLWGRVFGHGDKAATIDVFMTNWLNFTESNFVGLRMFPSLYAVHARDWRRRHGAAAKPPTLVRAARYHELLLLRSANATSDAVAADSSSTTKRRARLRWLRRVEAAMWARHRRRKLAEARSPCV